MSPTFNELEGAMSEFSPTVSVSDFQTPDGVSDGPFENEPIAIIGLGCRLPGGVRSPKELWELLVAEGSGQGDVPPSRFNIDGFYHPNGSERPGSLDMRGGYFLKENIRNFENSFFGINNLEATYMDPQQRKLLEVVYEAFESAGVPLEKVSGANIGTYVGSFAMDFWTMQAGDSEYFHRLSATVMGTTILANRISHTFNLRGPSLHLACTALDAGECDAAIVAAANLVQSPEQHIGTMKAGVLSPTSTCHTFDASADGYGRGEAVGALFIKKLSKAIEDGDPIRAVIRGTAVNSNGKTPGITLPSAIGQEAVIRKAYAKAGLHDFSQTGYVECHGTGTPVGDPIEVEAVSRVFGAGRIEAPPLYIGSIKPNLGHGEAASGISSIIKTTIVLEKGHIPPTIGLKKLNPKSKEKEWGIQVVTKEQRFPIKSVGGKHFRRAGVNSFGYGGANSHAILESPQTYVTTSDEISLTLSLSRSKFLIPLSASNPSAIEAQAAALATSPDIFNLVDLAHTLGTRRSRLSDRGFALVGQTTQKDDLQPERFRTTAMGTFSVLPIGFVFTGQGAQWPQMGKELLNEFPSFRSTIQDLDAVLQALPEAPSWTLEAVLTESTDPAKINHVSRSQPVCTAIQIAYVNLLNKCGIRPERVIGHSSGEIGAAYAAGFLTASQAITVAYYRGYVISTASQPVPGGMMAAGLDNESAKAEINALGLARMVKVACVNSPESVTYQELLEARLSALTSVTATHHARWVSSVHLEEVIGAISPNYWRENLESPALFSDAFGRLVKHSKYHLIEIGPHSALELPIKQTRAKIGLSHKLGQAVVLPGAAYLSMGIEAASQVLSIEKKDNPTVTFRNLHITKALELSPDTNDPGVEIFTTIRRASISRTTSSNRWHQFEISSHNGNSAVVHATGMVSIDKDCEALRKEITVERLGLEELAVRNWYDRFVKVGLNFGDSFRTIESVATHRRKKLPYAQATVPYKTGSIRGTEVESEYIVHPITIDALFQTGLIASSAGLLTDLPCKVPTSIIDAKSEALGLGVIQINAELHDGNGEVCAQLKDVKLITFQGAAADQNEDERHPMLRVVWKPDISKIQESSHLATYVKSFNATRRNSLPNNLVSFTAVVDLVAHKNPTLDILELGGSGADATKNLLDMLRFETAFSRCASYYRGYVSEDGEIFAQRLVSFEDVEDRSDKATAQTGKMFDVILLPSGESGMAYGIEKLSLIQGLLKDGGSGEKVVLRRLKNSDQKDPKMTSILVVEQEGDQAFNDFMAPMLAAYFKRDIRRVPLRQLSIAEFKSRPTVVSTIELHKPILSTLTAAKMTKVKLMTDNASNLIWLTGADLMDGTHPEYALVSGLSRAIMLEQPSLRFVVYHASDFEALSKKTARNLIAVIEDADRLENPDFEYVERNGMAHISRFVPDEHLNQTFRMKQDEVLTLKPLHDTKAARLTIQELGNFDTFAFEEDVGAKTELSGNHVEVSVKAIGLSQKDSYDTHFSDQKTYLMIGCLGGLGRSMSKWMIAQGAKKFVFLGRSGSDKPAARNLVEDLRGCGATVIVIRGDVCNYADVERCVAAIDGDIGGVVQAAMGLSESLWTTMSNEYWHNGIDAKLIGTFNLHNAINGKDSSLDFFLMTSSVSGSVGTATESNYCSANYFLDIFARYRRSQGLPATSVGLGMISEVGYLHENQEIEALLLRKALSSQPDRDSIATDPLAESHILTGLEPFGLKELRKKGFEGTNPTLNDARALLLSSALNRQSNSGGSVIASGLPEAVAAPMEAGGDILSAIVGVVVKRFSSLILVPVEKIDITTPITKFGMDTIVTPVFWHCSFPPRHYVACSLRVAPGETHASHNKSHFILIFNIFNERVFYVAHLHHSTHTASMTILYPDMDNQLQYTINTTSAGHLRRVLTRICAAIPEARGLIASELLVPEDKIPVPTSDDDRSIRSDDSEDEYDDEEDVDDDDENSSNQSQISGANNKRKREGSTSIADLDNPQKRFKPRYAYCIHCEEEYDLTENTNKSCRWHEEPRGEPDYDIYFADVDEPEIHHVDSDQYREEHPAGFIHECCGRNTLQPCRIGFHRLRTGRDDPELLQDESVLTFIPVNFDGDTPPSSVSDPPAELFEAVQQALLGNEVADRGVCGPVDLNLVPYEPKSRKISPEILPSSHIPIEKYNLGLPTIKNPATEEPAIEKFYRELTKEDVTPADYELDDAIDCASREDLQNILRDLCAKGPDFKIYLASCLQPVEAQPPPARRSTADTTPLQVETSSPMTTPEYTCVAYTSRGRRRYIKRDKHQITKPSGCMCALMFKEKVTRDDARAVFSTLLALCHTLRGLIDTPSTISATRLLSQYQQHKLNHNASIRLASTPNRRYKHQHSLFLTLTRISTLKMPVPNPKVDGRLEHAITSTSPEILQNIVKDLCADIPEARSYLSSRLLAPEDQVVSVKSTNGADGPLEAGSKRKRASQDSVPVSDDNKKLKLRYATCQNCTEDFDVTKNTSTSCHSHPMPYEIDNDYFQDDWEGFAGEWCKEEWPEAFIHPCCDRDISQEPCATGYHRKATGRVKERR
ncbi:uncharacterized protein BO66DRAFT_400146 [Aspergillus aculeatinus CBS 121060]|uniref:Uncharacterized protein n=1 Tax=Aspergillus aculeatinus CBS 121060 TaxID=1448322 RepID=A0ACD1HDR4_9EURO|nr:hypothetical protein BO66DRAFT_400146 [Aspergillus aculeatinus CBS 121060]RAH71709.1 hypothetical protein BO66DRAFT_400146 [Aspergillus aculeatinus CBS 121060]